MLPYPLLGLVEGGVGGCAEEMVGGDGVGILVAVFLKKLIMFLFF